MTTLQIEDSQLQLAVRAAKRAGKQAENVKKETASERKQNDTIVTVADREAETLVRNILQADSDHPILGEEHGGDIGGEETYWVIDPIDGTYNFSQEQPFYGCSIALVEANEPTIGVWYMPELDYLFYGVDGQGAYLNSDQLDVSKKADIEQSYSTISGKGRKQITPQISAMSERTQLFGSAVMTGSWVASGWCDVGVFGALAPWDMAVSVVLIRESGGVMQTVANRNTDWESISEGRVVFGNETLSDAVLENISTETVEIVKQAEYDW